MSTTTTLYGLPKATAGVSGWNLTLSQAMDLIDYFMSVRFSKTAGETIDQYEAVYFKSDGKIWLAQADGSKQPCIGLAIENIATDSSGRIQRVGEMTNAGWSWTVGAKIYLDPSTPGALTETPGGANDQIIGVATAATTLMLCISPSAVGAGLQNIVEDTTPQLGGNLDVNGKTIVSVSNGDITITPDGTGTVIITKGDITLDGATDSFGTASIADDASSQADPAAITATDVETADADSTYGSEEATLINEIKADFNLLKDDVEAIRTAVIGNIDYCDALKSKLNALLAELRATGGCGILSD